MNGLPLKIGLKRSMIEISNSDKHGAIIKLISVFGASYVRPKELPRIFVVCFNNMVISGLFANVPPDCVTILQETLFIIFWGMFKMGVHFTVSR